MKPSFTPCFFSNRSLYWLRSAITCAHVDLVEGREHGGGVLRFLQAARDGLAQPRHLHALLARGVVGRRGRAHLHGGGRLRDRRRRRGGALDRRQHVALGDAAVLAGARDGRGIDAAFGRELAHRRRERHVGPTLSARRRPWAVRAAAAPRPRRRSGSPSRSSGRAGRSARRAVGGGRARAFLIWPSSAPTATVSPSLAAIVAQHAGGRRRHLDRHLVGFELDQRLVDRDRIARLLEPLADGRLGHELAERRHADFSHGGFF